MVLANWLNLAEGKKEPTLKEREREREIERARQREAERTCER
jgi:hypothetical protein